MRANIFLGLLLVGIGPASGYAQQHSIGIGFKAGFNFANVTNASAINSSSRVGFNAGIFYSTPSKILGSRTEIIYSRRGYNYKSDTSNGSVDMDYIMLAQYLAIHITRFVEIDIGAQTAYLLSVKADSNKIATGNAQVNSLLSYYNRFDYGYGGGVEVHPIAGLLIGARYNISLSNLYKNAFTTNGNTSIDFKTNVVQVFAGYRF
jgi:opacity protein-like surface antigen